MIKIEKENIKEIKEKFVERIKKSIAKNKIEDLQQDKDFPDDELHRKITELYSCSAELLEMKNDEFDNYLTSIKANKDDINIKYFDYETIIDYKKDKHTHAYWLMNELRVNTCPYCNRQYTFTIEDKGIRPQFDHFYPQSKYPYLALSFYNLVPSCPTCNQIKLDKPINKNPYIEGFGNDYKFELKNKDNTKEDWCLDKNNIKVDFSSESENENIKVFGLKELYNEHIDYVEEIIDKAQAYNSTYYDSLIQSFSGLGKTPAEVDRYVWGNYIETADQCKRPLSKLTKDILEQLDIK